MVAAGEVTTFAGLRGQSGFADGVGSIARFGHANAITIDTNRVLYVTDGGGNYAVRKIDSSAAVTTFFTSSSLLGSPVGVAVDSNTDVYVSDMNTCSVVSIGSNGIYFQLLLFLPYLTLRIQVS